MAGSPPQRILIIRPSALGDVCRTVPVLVSLRAAYSDAAIDWVVQDGFVDAVSAHPALSEVIGFPRGRFARWWTRPDILLELLSWIRRLRKRRYDLVVDCQGLGRSGAMTFSTGASTRVGLRTARELGWVGYTDRHRPEPGLHTVDEMLSLLHPLGVPAVPDLRLYVPAAADGWWSARRQDLGLKDGRYGILAPTSRWPAKRWPADRWRRIVEPLRQRGLDRLLLIGAPSEREQIRAVTGDEAAPGLVDVCGETTVGQTMALIAGAELVVANDSAPLHMAVGLGRPYVGLFGPTDPARVGPYGNGGVVVRRHEPRPGESVSFKNASLGDRLMQKIEVDDVLAAVDRVLDPGAGLTSESERPQTVP
jgi:lipopolysaccharide heptosyltransferase I